MKHIDHIVSYIWRSDGTKEVIDTKGEGTLLNAIRRLEMIENG